MIERTLILKPMLKAQISSYRFEYDHQLGIAPFVCVKYHFLINFRFLKTVTRDSARQQTNQSGVITIF